MRPIWATSSYIITRTDTDLEDRLNDDVVDNLQVGNDDGLCMGSSSHTGNVGSEGDADEIVER